MANKKVYYVGIGNDVKTLRLIGPFTRKIQAEKYCHKNSEHCPRWGFNSNQFSSKCARIPLHDQLRRDDQHSTTNPCKERFREIKMGK